MVYIDIIDPIHDFVRVHEHELALVDSPLFQRLRRIRQLSGAHLTYPAAQHSRFEHSLGVMHIAGQAGMALQEKGILDPDILETLRLAGLLHDIGHGPFSHPFEEAMRGKKVSHEEFGKQIILHSEIGDILSQNGFDKRLVASVAFGESKYLYLNEIVSGALSADIMDYLLRDGYFTGAEHARIDHKRMTQSFDVHQGRLGLERSAQHSFESMMHSRYQMFKAVYFHKTVRAAEVMLIEALRSADDELGLATTDFDDFVRLADEYVISELVSSVSPGLKRARQLACDYQGRRLLKCVFEDTTDRIDKKSTDEMRSEISKKSGIPEDDIFVDSSATPSIPLAPSKSESKSLILISRKNGMQTAHEQPISEIPIVSAIAGFMNILRVYTHQKHRNKVEIAAHSVIGDAR
ncbi:MAG: HD domain-containing protein [Nitrosopumilus sp. H8]|nr:MAG: HD domain-containing protein [Nitrosopumilus sp. H13]RNJ79403.1 MAG: HD domain-containing protein [Nitrosopumilus sp. H8]